MANILTRMRLNTGSGMDIHTLNGCQNIASYIKTTYAKIKNNHSVCKLSNQNFCLQVLMLQIRTIVLLPRAEWVHPMAHPPPMSQCQYSKYPIDFAAEMMRDALATLTWAIERLNRKVNHSHSYHKQCTVIAFSKLMHLSVRFASLSCRSWGLGGCGPRMELASTPAPSSTPTC